MALTKKRAAKKAEKQAATAVAAAGGTAQKAEKAVEELQKLAAQVGPVVSEGAREARSRATELVDQYGPGVEEKLRAQGGKLASLGQNAGQNLQANLGPRADKIVHDVQEDYLPRARKTAETTGTVLKAAVDAARKELDKGQGDIKAAALVAPTAKKKSRTGKVLLVVGLAAIGATAGYLAWKKTRPVEDPWAPPADFARAHYPASAGDDSDSSTVSDTVGAADAGDVASSLESDEKRGTHRSDS
ncbi:hypothetical protein ACXET9_08170 [Brachybacterium sp. DNPG3]